jgi:hypothetical protein
MWVVSVVSSAEPNSKWTLRSIDGCFAAALAAAGWAAWLPGATGRMPRVPDWIAPVGLRAAMIWSAVGWLCASAGLAQSAAAAAATTRRFNMIPAPDLLP